MPHCRRSSLCRSIRSRDDAHLQLTGCGPRRDRYKTARLRDGFSHRSHAALSHHLLYGNPLQLPFHALYAALEHSRRGSATERFACLMDRHPALSVIAAGWMSRWRRNDEAGVSKIWSSSAARPQIAPWDANTEGGDFAGRMPGALAGGLLGGVHGPLENAASGRHPRLGSGNLLGRRVIQRIAGERRVRFALPFANSHSSSADAGFHVGAGT